jgi:peptide/nickel transport system permease protein
MRLVARRLLLLVPVLLAVTFLTYLGLDLLPGGPVESLAFGANQEQIDEIRHDLGLDDPLPVRYVRWLGNAVQGDLGESYVNHRPVATQLWDRAPVSLQLMLYAQIIALLIAIPLGVFTAYRANSWFDRAANTSAFGLLSVPNFIAAVLLVYLMSVKLGWFPAIGHRNFSDDPYEHFRHMVLPSLTLSVGLIAIYMRLLRTEMIATLQEDFIGMARAKGLPTARILFRHALKPSSFTLLTVAGIAVGNLIAGAVIVEQIFALPGMGRLLVTAILQRDYLLVQGAVVLISVAFVLVNFLVDLLYAALDPRIRHAEARA